MCNYSKDSKKDTQQRSPRDGESSQEILDSETLFGDKREVSIRHEGQVYKLRITRFGKLILNK